MLHYTKFQNIGESILKAVFLGMIIFLMPGFLAAQSRVQIIKADSIVGGIFQGQKVQKILGAVHLRNKDMEMYADSAYKFSGESKVEAFGNIELDTKEDSIWTDTLTYFTDIDFSKLRGRVIIKSDSTTLFGNSVDYRFTNKVAHFLDKIRLEDERGVLIANTGFYFRQADSATFRGQVQLQDSLKYIEGDSLFSNRSSKHYELYGNVFADDPENSSMLKADYLEADSTGRRLLKGHAWLKNFKKDSTKTDSVRSDSLQPVPADSIRPPHPDSLLHLQPDSLSLSFTPDSTAKASPDSSESSQPDTTHIQAKRILSLENRTPTDTTTTVKAYENVRIWSPDFSALSDSARYESAAHTFQLYSNAKAWNKKTQLTGPYIFVQLEHGDIKNLVSYPSPFLVQQDTVIDRLNQMKGDTLEASFVKGELRLLHVYQHSHLLRFSEKDGKPDGAQDLTAPTTSIYFENGKLIRLKSLGEKGAGIDGYYLPEKEQPGDTKLAGFSWDPDLRPKRPAEEMKRRFPPIPKEPPFELPKRYLKHIGRTDSTITKTDSLQAKTDSLKSH